MVYYMDTTYDVGDMLSGITPDLINFNIMVVILILTAIIFSAFFIQSNQLKAIVLLSAMVITGYILAGELKSYMQREYFVLNEPYKVIEKIKKSGADKVYFTRNHDTVDTLGADTIVLNPYDYGATPY